MIEIELKLNEKFDVIYADLNSNDNAIMSKQIIKRTTLICLRNHSISTNSMQNIRRIHSIYLFELKMIQKLKLDAKLKIVGKYSKV